MELIKAFDHFSVCQGTVGSWGIPQTSLGGFKKSRVNIRVFHWGRKVSFSLNYQEAQETEALKNYDSIVSITF